MYEGISDPEIGPYPIRLALGPLTLIQSSISLWGWGFHTVLGGIDPRDRRFRPRCAGVADVWKYF